MMHLLRSLFVGYFITITAGAVAVMNGYGPLSVVLSVWLAGSVLSVAIAASVTPLDDSSDEMALVTGKVDASGPPAMPRDLRARELALWDADLHAERFDADLAAERAEAEAAAQEASRKTG